MIVSKNTHPERDLYYLGAKTIEVLNSSDKDEWDYFDLFSGLNQKYKVSLNLFSLILDRLFILNVIKKRNEWRDTKMF
jgi:hypothetical protein